METERRLRDDRAEVGDEGQQLIEMKFFFLCVGYLVPHRGMSHTSATF